MKVLILFLSVLSLAEFSEFGKCGQTKFNAGLIVHGKNVLRGEFPFMCALHHIEGNQVFCGGTLVTSKHVITAAHCMRPKDEEIPLDPRDLLVLLGAYNLKARHESGALQEHAIDITIHPQWKITRNDYDSDIAVITLKNQIEFSMYVRPVCFPAEDDMKFNTDQSVGTVVGWGAINGSLTIQDKPAKATVTTRTNEHCFLLNPNVLAISSLQTFCAIGENTGPCSGDSGGGFFEQIENSWTIRGIISATTLMNSQCDLSQYAVYTNIGMFYDWIKETITRKGCPGASQSSCFVQNVRPPQKTATCGVRKKATGLIVRGENFDRGDFPWMVALYRRFRQRRLQYYCGGSVISDRHVLTAANCVYDLLPRDITALFGAYDLDDQLEDGRFAQSPSSIFVHDHWDSNSDKFDADIAMLLMPEKIAFSSFVQPICLWKFKTEPAVLVGLSAGWGQSQNRSRDHETIPAKLELPIHTNERCFLKFPHLAERSSNRTFCGGAADGRGPCNGDSGGGLYVSVENVFYLKGIISASLDVNIFGECLLKKNSIYIDVLKFKDWIDTTMTRN